VLPLGTFGLVAFECHAVQQALNVSGHGIRHHDPSRIDRMKSVRNGELGVLERSFQFFGTTISGLPD